MTCFLPSISPLSAGAVVEPAPGRVYGATPESLFDNVFSSKPSVVWRSTESAHRFWQPIDPADYQVPEEYIGSAISFDAAAASTCPGPASVVRPESIADEPIGQLLN